MSGPKIDHAEIQRQQREALERARQERLRKIREATDVFQRTISDVSVLCKDIQIDREHLQESVTEKKEMAITIKNIRNIKAEYVNLFLELLNSPLPTEPEAIINRANTIKSNAITLKSEYEERVAAEFERILAFNESQKAQNNLEEFSSSLDSEYKFPVIGDIDFVFDSNKEMTNKKYGGISESLQVIMQQNMKEIESLINADGISKTDRKVVTSYLKKITDAGKQNSAMLKAAIKEYDTAKGGILKRIRSFDSLYQDYTAEYVLYLGEVNKLRKQKISIKPKSKNKFTSIEKLEHEVTMLRKCSQKAYEDNYIREQLSAVMSMFGYNLCEDVVLSTEQIGNHYVCPDKTRKNAIHVHVSDTKQIMMEVVGFENRKVTEETGISAIVENVLEKNEAEARKLLDEQGRFCNIHPQIMEELSKRGINLTAKVHRKPDLKYCKKIINLVSDEDINWAVTDENDLINTAYAERRFVRKKAERAIKL